MNERIKKSGAQTTGQEGAADQGPLLGALLRLAHQSLIRRVLAELARGGITSIQSVHFSVFQALWDHPKGLRLTDLAEYARITKQSMGEFVVRLSELGYVTRVPDPEDGRAVLVRLTRSGRALGRLARTSVRDIEKEWADRVGADRIEAMRETLKQILRTDT